jgi:hypothetical protein
MSTLAWKGPDFAHGDELLDALRALVQREPKGSRHFASLEPGARPRDVLAAIRDAQDDLIADRERREVYRGEDPETDHLERVYTLLAEAVDYADEAGRAIENMDAAAIKACGLILDGASS